MIRVAAGQPLPLAQSDLRLDGWSMEARVYAEDPYRGFLPSVGRLVRYLPPAETETVRVDTGVYEGGEVSMYYDPMIAKLITHGATREEARIQMRDALKRVSRAGCFAQHQFSVGFDRTPEIPRGSSEHEPDCRRVSGRFSPVR